MFKFETASTDKNYHFYISLGGFKCGVRLMLDRVKLVNEPDNPRFLRPFERAIKNLKSSKERIKKFTLVTPVNVDEKSISGQKKSLRLALQDPLINFVIEVPEADFTKEQAAGRVGLQIPCIMEVVDKS